MDLRQTTREQLTQAGITMSYWPMRGMPLDHDHCFLCSVELTTDNRTDEHVIPRWVQRDCDLWNQQLTLLNRTPIRYKHLTIPCCSDCNGLWLARVEARVAQAFRSGPAAVEKLDKTVLCLWMAKLYYGLHFKELALPLKREEPAGRRIVERDRLARHSELHHVLQAIRDRVRFDHVPGSIRIFRAQVPQNPQQRFDYWDLQAAPYLAIRIGATVVISSLLDWGAMNGAHEPHFDIADQLELHPLQFAEVAAFGAYLALRFNWRFAYRIAPHGDHDVITPLRVGTSEADRRRPPFHPFVIQRMAVVLAEFTGWSIDDVYKAEPQGLWSSLLTADGRPGTLDLGDVPADAVMAPPNWRAEHPGYPVKPVNFS